MKRLLLCAALIAWSGLVSAGVVYKWVDVDGKVHYGDQPPDDVTTEIMRVVHERGLA